MPSFFFILFCFVFSSSTGEKWLCFVYLNYLLVLFHSLLISFHFFFFALNFLSRLATMLIVVERNIYSHYADDDVTQCWYIQQQQQQRTMSEKETMQNKKTKVKKKMKIEMGRI